MEKIKFKRTSTAGVTPTVAQCDKGELVINSTDRKLFTQDESGNIVELGASLAERYAMPKVQFDANREANKEKFAGSGWVNWGKHFDGWSGRTKISEGLFAYPEIFGVNCIFAGANYSENEKGISKTKNPVVNVDGALISLEGVAESNAGYPVRVKFPPSPDGTKSYDSATGIVTDHLTYLDPKYDNTAALSQSDAVSRCFEGVCKNGDFRFGAEGWDASGSDSSVSNSGAVIVNPHGTTVAFNLNNRTVPISAGNYTVELTIAPKSTKANVKVCNIDIGEIPLTGEEPQIVSFNISVPSSHPMIYIGFYRIGHAITVKISNISIRPVTSAPILTRQDLVFVEVNPDAECTVFKPLGNNQYGATTAEGIRLKKLTDLGIPQSVSGFGPWDSATVGYGELISSLTDAQLKTVLSNPKNNICFDPIQNKLLQSEYKICVDEGCNDTDTVDARMTKLGYVKDTVDVTRYNHSDGRQAIGVCLRQTLNQGAYHPQFNPSGCALWGSNINEEWAFFWHSTNIGNNKPKNSTVDCFLSVTKNNNGTGIGGIGSGRPSSFPDQFYDAVYAHQIKDLRLSAHKQDVNKLRVDAMRKAVSGEMRGWDKVPFTHTYDANCNIYLNGNRVGIGASAGFINSITQDVEDVKHIVINNQHYKVISVDTGYSVVVDRAIDYTGLTEGDAVAGWQCFSSQPILVTTYLTPQNDTLAWTDLIGSPENISKCFPNGCVGQWLPVIPDGTSKEFHLNAKSLTTPFGMYTSDNGGTWRQDPQIVVNWKYDGVKNSFSSPAFDASYVYLTQYPTLSNFTEPSNNSVGVGEVGDVIITTRHEVNQGNRLHGSLLDNIGKDTTDPLLMVSKTKQTATSMSHQPHDLDIPANNSTGCKVATSIIEKDGLLYSQYQSQEIQHSKSSRDWGDNLAIPVVNGDATNVDANDITVKVSNHIDLIPLGIASHSDSSQSS